MFSPDFALWVASAVAKFAMKICFDTELFRKMSGLFRSLQVCFVFCAETSPDLTYTRYAQCCHNA